MSNMHWSNPRSFDNGGPNPLYPQRTPWHTRPDQWTFFDKLEFYGFFGLLLVGFYIVYAIGIVLPMAIIHHDDPDWVPRWGATEVVLTVFLLWPIYYLYFAFVIVRGIKRLLVG